MGACNTPVDTGENIVVSNGEECANKLVRPSGIVSPAIPVQTSGSNVKLRDGSDEHSIDLPALSKKITLSVAGLIVREAGGQLKVWDASQLLGKKKLIIDDGVFQLVDDLNTDLFIGDMCIGTHDGIDGIIGYKDVLVQCDGLPDVPATQLFKIPACYVGDVPEPTD